MRIAIAALLLSLAALSPAAASDLSKLHDQMITPSVFLTMGEGFCSGEIIYSNRDQDSGDVSTYVLTAKHCVANLGSAVLTVSIPTYDDSLIETGSVVYRATVDATSWKHDVALLLLDDKKAHFDKVAKIAAPDAVLIEGEDSWTVGYPLATSRTITKGLIGTQTIEDTGFLSENGGGSAKLAPFVRGTSQIAPGSSGGALYHMTAAGDYELVGTVTGGYSGHDFVALYSGFADVDDFLKSQESDVFNALFPNYKDPKKAKPDPGAYYGSH